MNVVSVVNILDLFEEIGEDEVGDILSNFSCPLNHEIEHFLKTNALQFAREKNCDYISCI